MNFKDQVFEQVKRIPKGKVATYGQISNQFKILNLKIKIDARIVGWVLHANKDPKVPCHRMIKSDGRLGGYSGGAKKKEVLLRKEGVETINRKIKNFYCFLI